MFVYSFDLRLPFAVPITNIKYVDHTSDVDSICALLEQEGQVDSTCVLVSDTLSLF